MKKFRIYNETDICLKKEIYYMKKILKEAIKFENTNNVYFNVIIVDNDYIHNLNKTYRKIDRETDVITFALEDIERDKVDLKKKKLRRLGDIYISVDKATLQATEYGHSRVREMCFLAVHGFLHLLGYDHMKEEDEKIMFGKQEMILDGKKYAKR